MTVGKLTVLAARMMLMAAMLVSPGAPVMAQDATAVPNNRSPQRTCGETPSGLVVYVPVDEAGNQAPGLNVADPSMGKIVASLDLPLVDRLIPLRAKGKAVASTATDEYYLIDAVKATSSRLEISPDAGSLVEWTQGIPPGAGIERTLLSDGRDLFLLEVESGALTDLRALLPADSPPVPLSAMLSPDEQWVLLWDGIRLWLLPADQPDAIRPLTPDEIASLSGSFSADSKQLIYQRESASGETNLEVVIEPVDGTSDPAVITSGNVFGGVFVKGTEVIAFQRAVEEEDSLVAQTVLLDRDTGDERVLVEQEVNPVTLIPSPEGTHLMLQIFAGDAGPRYVDIDLATGATVELRTIDGLYLFGPAGNRWRIAMPLSGISSGALLPGYYAVDLETGTATILAPLTADESLAATQPIFSRNGRIAMSAVFAADAQRLWMFDLPEARGIAVRTGAFSSAGISPDGCRFVVASLEEPGGAMPMISIDTLELDDSVKIGPGISPVWVAS